jgi:hypothetical protein
MQQIMEHPDESGHQEQHGTGAEQQHVNDVHEHVGAFLTECAVGGVRKSLIFASDRRGGRHYQGPCRILKGRGPWL